MKDSTQTLLAILLKIVLISVPIVGAVLLALNGISGWGWFLLIAILLAM